MMEKKRSPNFTSDEKIKLVQLVKKHIHIILNKKTDGSTNKAKENAWHSICSDFNDTSNLNRSIASLHKMWHTLKYSAKTYKSKPRISIVRTGGGLENIRIDPILEEVLTILGRGSTGLMEIKSSDVVDVPISSNGVMITEMVGDENPVEKTAFTSPSYIEIDPLNMKSESYESTTITTNSSSTSSNSSDFNHHSTNPFGNLRLPNFSQENYDILAAKVNYKNAKKKIIEEDNIRAGEMHLLKKKKVELEIEIRTLIIKKLKNNEDLNPAWIELLKD